MSLILGNALSTTRATLFAIAVGIAATASAAEWSSETHILASGDFNGDGRRDLLVVAKNPAAPSGIALSNGTSPSVLHQSWASNYLSIDWANSVYLPHVGDFNGDNRDDVFLQRVSGGDHYVLLTDSTFKLTSVYDTVSNTELGINWSQAERRIQVGDFSYDGRDDLYLQATSIAVANVVAFANGGGYFTVNHTFANAYLNLEWNVPRALEYAGEFNGNGYADLLLQAKPDWVPIPYRGRSIPIPRYRDESYGIVLSDGTGKPATVNDTWDHDHLGIEWSPIHYNAFVGNFDGACYDDILLQAKTAIRSTYIVLTNCSGQVPSNATVHELAPGYLSLNWDAGSYEFHVGDFDGNGRDDIYMQTPTPAGTSRIAFTDSAGDITGTPAIHAPGALTLLATTYEYNALGRLAKVTYDDGSYVAYTYDAAGNRTVVAGVKN